MRAILAEQGQSETRLSLLKWLASHPMVILGPIAAVAASIVMAVATHLHMHCGPLAGSAAPWGP